MRVTLWARWLALHGVPRAFLAVQGRQGVDRRPDAGEGLPGLQPFGRQLVPRRRGRGPVAGPLGVVRRRLPDFPVGMYSRPSWVIVW